MPRSRRLLRRTVPRLCGVIALVLAAAPITAGAEAPPAASPSFAEMLSNRASADPVLRGRVLTLADPSLRALDLALSAPFTAQRLAESSWLRAWVGQLRQKLERTAHPLHARAFPTDAALDRASDPAWRQGVVANEHYLCVAIGMEEVSDPAAELLPVPPGAVAPSSRALMVRGTVPPNLLANFVLGHEFGHCAHGFMAEDGLDMTAQALWHEAGADAYAALELLRAGLVTAPCLRVLAAWRDLNLVEPDRPPPKAGPPWLPSVTHATGDVLRAVADLAPALEATPGFRTSPPAALLELSSALRRSAMGDAARLRRRVAEHASASAMVREEGAADEAATSSLLAFREAHLFLFGQFHPGVEAALHRLGASAPTLSGVVGTAVGAAVAEIAACGSAPAKDEAAGGRMRKEAGLQRRPWSASRSGDPA